MLSKELMEFIEWTLSSGGRWKWDPAREQDVTKRTFAQTIKLAEEVGELSSEILWHTWFARTEKLSKYSHETLKEEFADVVLATIRLARFMDIDIESAIKDKMAKIRERHSK